VAAFLADDRARQLAIFDRERPAEAATGLAILHLDEGQAFDGRQQTSGLTFDPQLAQPGTGIVIGDHAVVTSGYGNNAELVDEKADQLVAFGREDLGLVRELGFVGEQLGIVLGDHAAARAAGRHDIVATREGPHVEACDPLGVGSVSRIVGGLAATGLRRHDHPTSRIFQQFDGGKSDARAHRVDKAGHEQADARRGILVIDHRPLRPSSKAAAALIQGSMSARGAGR